MSAIPDTPRSVIDSGVETLAANAGAWLKTTPAEKAALLREAMARFADVAAEMVAEGVTAKGLDGSYAGEEWVSGPVPVLRTARFLADTLEGIASTGRVPLADSAIKERPGGQVSVDVLPGDGWDRALWPGWSAEVWMEPGIALSEARQHLGSIHTKPEAASPAVAAVLGAGNVASITPLDLVHKLFFEGHVATVKFSPVNDYIGPFVEHTFSPLVEEGWVRFAYGGSEVGGHIVNHPGVDEVHLTGSEHTHDAIVFGAGPEGAARKARNEPILDKPVTSELGNVSPVIVLPGEWSPRAIEAQARHVATQVVHNGGYNCNAAKVLVLPPDWPQRDEFVEAVARSLASRPPRLAYYPGTEERYERALTGAGKVRVLGAHGNGFVAPTLLEQLEPDASALTEESFCQLVAVVDLAGEDAGGFLERAVDFCNEDLRGSLNVTLLVDPDTAKRPETGLGRAVEALRYGSVGINVWAAAAFPLGVTPWGAFPGHTRDDIGSGIGFVHNARMVDRPQKTVVTAPFRMVPMPPWSVFHRRSTTTLRALARFEAKPGPGRLAAILAGAIRP